MQRLETNSASGCAYPSLHSEEPLTHSHIGSPNCAGRLTTTQTFVRRSHLQRTVQPSFFPSIQALIQRNQGLVKEALIARKPKAASLVHPTHHEKSAPMHTAPSHCRTCFDSPLGWDRDDPRGLLEFSGIAPGTSCRFHAVLFRECCDSRAENRLKVC